MINGKKVIAIIPARGGSKRLPRKNILSLGNKPLIAWTIEAAKNSKYIDNVFVSTDDQEIADIACEFGANVPELRPSELSSDVAKTQTVLLYVLNKFGKDADIVILLQPTSPFRNEEHIDEALELFIKKGAYSIISVTPCEHPPLWANILPEDDSMKDFIRKNLNSVRSQDLGEFYRLNGAIYIYNVRELIQAGSMENTARTYAYKMESKCSIDIDNQIDFDMAEFFFDKKTQKTN
ncbi:cytidylyltransferase domain-containing protein [Shewanella salipaludis]|uniref:Acylneuraminate cytidylyltransferase family protein n=1 Tax=Shewanella salipaludis TaxID=2723052 RepID=A0A972FZL2_9GAMM|nr:acylneuraminate cytidylyltransferase family protein [Shewanella salipaludis]NMH65597.1 acylneuraminate cytidylyltransferase family protein [Shewanella salipaludis]